MAIIFVRLIADAALVGLLLFASAGTVVWPRAWALVAVLLIVRMATAVVVYRVNPALLRDRAKLPLRADQPWVDKVLLLGVIATGFLGLPVIAGFDLFRLHLLPPVPTLVADAGLAVFTLGWILKGLALHANAFATAVVRLQHERQHAVVDTGVYGVVRHPFYAGTPLVLVGQALWLQSSAATVAVVIPIVLLIARLVLEERFLRRELPGYVEYAVRVRHRLVPGVW